MRKVHQKIANLVTNYLQQIASGNKTMQVAKVNKNCTITLQNSEQFYHAHPITAIHNVKHFVQVKYCSTNIITVGISNDTLYCYINNGGYSTKTTKGYINAVLNELKLPYYIRIKNYAMQLMQTNNDSDNVVPDFYGSYLLTKEL